MSGKPNPSQPIQGPGGGASTETENQEPNATPKTVPYDRFQQVVADKNATAAELETLRAEKAQREEQEAIKRGEHETVINTLKEEKQGLETLLSNVVKDGAIRTAALQAGAIDPEDVLLNLKDKVTVQGDAVAGLDEALADLKTRKAHLFGTPKGTGLPATPANGTPPPGDLTAKAAAIREAKNPLDMLTFANETRGNNAGPDARR